MLRISENLKDIAGLHHFACIHDADPVRDLRDKTEIMRDQHDRGAVRVLKTLQDIQNLRLDRNIERCRRLIGDQKFRCSREHHRNHDTLTHAAGKFVRIALCAKLGIRKTNIAEQRHCLFLRRRLIRIVEQNSLFYLRTDAVDRIQRIKRILKDHSDLTSAHLLDLFLIESRKILSLEQNFSGDFRVLVRKKTKNAVGNR